MTAFVPPHGKYPLADAMALIDSSIVYVETENSPVTLARITAQGDLIAMGEREAKLIFGTLQYIDADGKSRPALDYWLKNWTVGKRYLRPVFKKPGTESANEHNLFRGFAVQPAPGLLLARPFLRHLFRQVAGSNRKMFRYLIKWLAWMVQNIGSNPETALILISETEGAGKSLINRVFEPILGETHCQSIGSPLALYDNKNAFSRRWILVLADDIKDMKPSDTPKLRGYLTDNWRRIEEKFVPVIYVPNCLHLVITSNSETPIPLGRGSRRYVVYRVLEDHIGDFPYFKRIEGGIDSGGAGQLLRFLLNVKLGKFHPREIPPLSEEIYSAQVEAANSVIKWLLVSRDMDGFVGVDNGKLVTVHNAVFGKPLSFATTYSLYSSWARFTGTKPESTNMAGRVLKKLFGPSSYERNMQFEDGSRGRGHIVPSIEEFDLRLEAEFNPAKRHDLEKRCQKVRAVKPSPADIADFKPHQASALAAALFRAWPKKHLKKSMSYGAMLNEASVDREFKKVLDAILVASLKDYHVKMTPDVMTKIIRAFAGATIGSEGYFILDPQTGDLLRVLDPATNVKLAPEPPIGVAVKRSGVLWNTVTNNVFEEA